jgi:D-glycero-alpha-D-manno-heptose 1-phosphate guanylyltransferase
MKVIILAGGLGSRLQSVVKDIPKPMADINGIPFLELLITNMINYGASEFILCVSYKREIIFKYFGDTYQNIPIKYSVEQNPLGTGGAIKQAFDVYNVDNAVVINGDSFIKMDYSKFYSDFKNENFAIALKYAQDTLHYGLVETKNSKAIKFEEKMNNVKAGYINAGVYLINKNLWKIYSLSGKFSFEKDVLERYIKEYNPKFLETDEYFIDIGVPENYKKACEELEEIVRTY